MYRKIGLLIGALVLSLSLLVPASAQSGNARVRVIHASPDAPAVDVYVDGSAVLTNVAFRAISDYLSLPAGPHRIAVAPAGAGESAAVITANPTLDAGMAYTIAAVGNVANIQAQIYNDNLAAPAAGRAHVRVIHASPDAPAVDVRVAGGPALFSNLAFPNASDYLPVDAGSYNLQVTPAGATDVVIDLPNTNLTAGTIYDVVAVGPLASIGVEVATFTPAAAQAPGTLPDTGIENQLSLVLLVVALGALAGGLFLRRRLT
jgi:LPXTG-motif cell wall-anchored protein